VGFFLCYICHAFAAHTPQFASTTSTALPLLGLQTFLLGSRSHTGSFHHPHPFPHITPLPLPSAWTHFQIPSFIYLLYSFLCHHRGFVPATPPLPYLPLPPSILYHLLPSHYTQCSSGQLDCCALGSRSHTTMVPSHTHLPSMRWRPFLNHAPHIENSPPHTCPLRITFPICRLVVVIHTYTLPHIPTPYHTLYTLCYLSPHAHSLHANYHAHAMGHSCAWDMPAHSAAIYAPLLPDMPVLQCLPTLRSSMPAQRCFWLFRATGYANLPVTAFLTCLART